MWSLFSRFFRDCLPALALASGGLVVLACLGMAAQALSSSPVVPSAAGAGAVVLGYLPAAAAVALPVGLLVGVVVASMRWAEAGEWLGLASCGLGTRSMVPAVLLLGLVAGGLEAGLTHVLEPAGRRLAHRSIAAATSEVRLRPGQPVVMEGVLLHAGGADGAELSELFLAQEDAVAGARRGRLRAGGVLELEQGSARGVTSAGEGWTLRFDEARVALLTRGRRVELAERSAASLLDLIQRTEQDGRAASYERLIWYKRTTQALSLPLLALLGLPLGARRVSPTWVALGVVLGWWSLIRLCDQAVRDLGPELGAAIPPSVLAVAVAWSWLRWKAR